MFSLYLGIHSSLGSSRLLASRDTPETIAPGSSPIDVEQIPLTSFRPSMYVNQGLVTVSHLFDRTRLVWTYATGSVSGLSLSESSSSSRRTI